MLSVNYAECRNPYAESRYAERRGAIICATLKFKFILPRKHNTSLETLSGTNSLSYFPETVTQKTFNDADTWFSRKVMPTWLSSRPAIDNSYKNVEMGLV